jgi:hypothetical protein
VSFSDTFHTGGDVHAIPEDIVAVDYNVTDVDSDPDIDALILGHGRAALGYGTLDFDSTPDSIHGTGKLHQQAISGRLNDTTAMLSDLRIDQFAPTVFSRSASSRPLPSGG